MDNIINSYHGKVSPLGKLSPPYMRPNYYLGWNYLPIKTIIMNKTTSRKMQWSDSGNINSKT